MRTFLRKKLDGSFVPACEMSEHLARKISVDELIEIDWPSRKTRSGKWHKRYWGLLRLIYQNTERFKSEQDVHFWLKRETGLFDGCVDLPDGSKAYFVKSISYDEMTADEWADYWKRAVDVVHREILPTVDLPMIEYEIEKCAGLAA